MRTLRIPAEDQRTAGKPPGSEPGLVLQSPVLLSAEWEGGSDNYWGGPDQQDVTHLKGGGGSLWSPGSQGPTTASHCGKVRATEKPAETSFWILWVRIS